MELPAIPGIVPAEPNRPPGALADVQFNETCSGCGDCVEVCPVQIVEFDARRLPHLTVSEACTDCGLCVDVCMFGALHHTPETQAGLDRLLRRERHGP